MTPGQLLSSKSKSEPDSDVDDVGSGESRPTRLDCSFEFDGLRVKKSFRASETSWQLIRCCIFDGRGLPGDKAAEATRPRGRIGKAFVDKGGLDGLCGCLRASSSAKVRTIASKPFILVERPIIIIDDRVGDRFHIITRLCCCCWVCFCGRVLWLKESWTMASQGWARLINPSVELG